MKKSRSVFKRVLVAVISIALFLGTIVIPAKTAEAAVWYSGDPFTDIGRSKKGTQSFLPTEVVNTSNIFINAHMETSFPKDDKSDIASFHVFPFEGDTYYFKVPSGMEGYDSIVNLNNKDLTVTVQFILKYDPEKARLIEPSARAYPGFAYYAPNMTEPAVVKEYRAYMAFLAETFSTPQCHVDAWVCGNEVNAGYHWNFFGSDCMAPNGSAWKVSNPDLLMEKYCKFYDIVYDAMKEKNKKTRVCVCVDHCWTETDNGNIIPTKTFLNMFAAKEGKEKDWCIAYHAYPADLNKPDIWSNWNGHVWNPKNNENAQFIDGYNLETLTGYVKSNFGSNHRIMLTEQGFSKAQDEDIQAACLVYTFYKARFDDMIDVMHVMKFPGCGYELGTKASQIWEKLDNGSDADEQWILSQVGGTLGISSFSQITPNWKSQGTIQAEIKAFKDANPCYYQGVDYSPVFDYEYYVAENPVLNTFWGRKPTFDEAFWYFSTYSMDRTGKEGSPIMKSHPDFDLIKYKSDHPELVAQFGDNNRAYYTYYCSNFSADPTQVTAFVRRFYKEVLGRTEEGINSDPQVSTWINKLINKEANGAEVAYGFAKSKEFTNRDLNNAQFLTTMYKAFFDREPDADGYNDWYNKLQSGQVSREQVIAGFTNSGEFQALCKKFGINAGSLNIAAKPQPASTLSPLNVDTTNVDPAQLDAFVERLYDKALVRPSDAGGKEYWKGCILNGKDDQGREYDIRTVISKGFLNSQEYKNRDRNNAEFVLDCYAAFFDRNPVGTPDEPNYWNWVQQLNDGTITRQQMIERGFGDSKEFRNLITSYGFVIQ
jgi:hypothetical protein